MPSLGPSRSRISTPGREVVTGTRLRRVPTSSTRSTAGEARIVHYGDERVAVRARSAHGGLVVLSDTDYPGWKAEVDGHQVPLRRVDYLFRGVQVGPGTHTIVLRYEPSSYRVGWILSLLAVLGLAGLVQLAPCGGARPPAGPAGLASPGRSRRPSRPGRVAPSRPRRARA